MDDTTGHNELDSEDQSAPSRVKLLIDRAFSEEQTPTIDELLIENLSAHRPFEAQELTKLLLGRSWKSLTPKEIEEHSDWLVYLSPQALAYFLPAWLTNAMRLPGSYVAQFVQQYVRDWTTAQASIFNDDQLEVIRLCAAYLEGESGEWAVSEPK